MDKFIAKDLSFRVVAVDATAVVREMQGLQNTYPLATMAVGRSMVAALLMAAQLKDQHEVSLYFRGDGPLETVFAQASFEGEVRGYTPNPQLEMPLQDGRLDVGKAVGKGFLTVVRTLPLQSQSHRGTVEIQTGEIGDDVAFYYQQSHQTPSVVALGVKVNAYGFVVSAGGVLMELMPGATDNLIGQLEKAVQSAGSLSEALEKGATAADLAKLFTAGHELMPIPHPHSARYSCRCSVARVERSLALLGVPEIEDMIQKSENAEVRCEFCGRLYVLSGDALSDLVMRLKKTSMH